MALSVIVPLSCLVLASPARAATFTPLGDLPGGEVRSQGLAVSGDGLVVVGSSPSSRTLAFVEAFRWTAEAGMVGLGASGSFGMQASSSAFGVSNDGAVVVGRDGIADFEAFRWTATTGRVGLGFLPGDPPAANSIALSTSADGSVVVGQSGLVGKAFRWTAQEGMVSLGEPAGLHSSVARDASADGTIIVGYIESFSVVGAFRWTSDTGIVPLGFGGDAYAVSPDGNFIVGTDGSQAFRWTAQSGVVRLGDLPGGRVLGIAYDVSANGSVIVGSGETSFDGTNGTSEAFYWTADTGMLNLREALIFGGATALDGWTLTEARGVSSDGLTVVGTGVHNGVTEAWVATVGAIPEPSTLMLAVIAVAAIIMFRRLSPLSRRCT